MVRQGLVSAVKMLVKALVVVVSSGSGRGIAVKSAWALGVRVPMLWLRSSAVAALRVAIRSRVSGGSVVPCWQRKRSSSRMLSDWLLARLSVPRQTLMPMSIIRSKGCGECWKKAWERGQYATLWFD